MDKYNEYVELFKSKDCELLTTFEEFNELRKEKAKPCLVRLNIRASCGHKRIINIKNFNQNKKDIICNECVKVKNKNIQKENQPDIENSYLSREIDFTRNFQDFIRNDFMSELTKEGCESDLIIKPINISDDKWLKIQIKLVNDKYRNFYRVCLFNKKDKYLNNIMLFNCIKEDIYWLIPYEDISHVGERLMLRTTERSIYSKYIIDKKDIIECLKNYYKNTILYEKNKCMIPISDFSKKEFLYRQKIYDNLSFLNIEEPKYTNMKYDLIINNKKIQEKIPTKHTDTTYNVKLSSITNMKKMSYIKGDNDFYWIHIPDKELFFVIPEFELLKRNLIGYKEHLKRKSLFINLKNNDAIHSWVMKFMFNYKNIDKDTFINFINIDYSQEIKKYEDEYNLSKQFEASCSIQN